MRRHRLLLVLGVCALLLTPSAGGGPAVPGDPTPPVVTPHFFGTLGLNGWWVIERHAQLDGRGSGVPDPGDARLRRGHAHQRHGRHVVHVLREERRRRDDGHGHDPARQDRARRHRHAARAARTRTAGTTTRSRSASAAPTRPRGSTPASRRRPTRARTTRTRPSPAPAATGRGTRRSSTFALSYDATAPTGDRRERVARRPITNGWYNHTLSVTFTGTDATSGIDTCTQTTLLRARSAQRLGHRHLPRPGREHEREQRFDFQYDETGPVVTATPVAQPGLERLVQPRALGQLQRHRRDLGDRHLRPAAGLLGPGQRERLGHRLLHRPGREHERRARSGSATTRRRRR